MSKLLESMLKFWKEKQELIGDVGDVWRASKFEGFALNVIRKLAIPDDRLAAYDELVDYLNGYDV